MLYDPFYWGAVLPTENYSELARRFGWRYCYDLDYLWRCLPKTVERHALADIVTWKPDVHIGNWLSLNRESTARICGLLLADEHVIVTVLKARRGIVKLLREGNHRVDILRSRGLQYVYFNTVHIDLGQV